MFKGQALRALVTERLTAAAEDIFALVERTIAEYEEELSRSKEENQRKQQLLDLSSQLHRADVKTKQESVENSPRPEKTEEKSTQVFEVGAVQVKTEDEEQPSSLLHQILSTKNPNREETQIEPNGERNFHCDDQQQSGPLWQNPNEPAADREETFQNTNQEGSYDCDDLQQSAHSSDTDDSKDWGEKAGPSTQQMEADDDEEDGYEQIMIGENFSMTNINKLVLKEQARHMCFVCGKVFARGSALKRHSVVHTGERPFSCPLCDKTFKQNAHLKVHMCSHTGLMPFRCSICSRGFTRKNKYLKHAATHKERRPGPASDKRFNQKLQAPAEKATRPEKRRKDRGKASLSHLECDAGSSTNVGMFDHMTNDTGTNAFSCPFCQKSFLCEKDVDEHMKIHIEDGESHGGSKDLATTV